MNLITAPRQTRGAVILQQGILDATFQYPAERAEKIDTAPKFLQASRCIGISCWEHAYPTGR